jgi:cation-transporting P-type ATPase C
MTKVDYYIHYTPGRMRIQTPVLQDNPVRAEEFEDYFKRVHGIVSVRTNSTTGSALFYFDEKKINCEQIIGILESHDYFSLVRAETSDQFVEQAAEKILDVAGKALLDFPIGGED